MTLETVGLVGFALVGATIIGLSVWLWWPQR